MKCSICSGSSFLRKINGGKICRKCTHKLPSEIKKRLRNTTVYEIKQFFDYQNEHSVKDFQLTSSLGSLGIDERHGYICVSSKEIHNTIKGFVIPLLDTENARLCVTNPRVIKKHVYVDIKFVCSIHNLRTDIDRVIKRKVLCDSKRIDPEHLEWKEPEIVSLFQNIITESAVHTADRWNEYIISTRNLIEDIQIREARILLMVDENASKDEIKEQRNRLAKIYHPDVSGLDGKYMEKINKAYKTLLEHTERETRETN